MNDSGNTSKEKHMRIWYQLLASNARSVENIASVQRLCDQVAAPGTIVRGTVAAATGHTLIASAAGASALLDLAG